jgi:transcriptional regulator with XRE-family HTH domain
MFTHEPHATQVWTSAAEERAVFCVELLRMLPSAGHGVAAWFSGWSVSKSSTTTGHNSGMTTEDGATSGSKDPWQPQADTLGGFIRMQRQLAHLSLREMAAMTAVSNAYLSQVERDLHQPSLKVMQSIADALGIPTTDLLRQAGVAEPEKTSATSSAEDSGHPDTERAIKTDPRLSQAQREALLGVYRSFLAER